MKLRDYLISGTTEELTNRLIQLDKAIKELHENGYFVVSDLAEIEINDNQVTVESFKEVSSGSSPCSAKYIISS